MHGGSGDLQGVALPSTSSHLTLLQRFTVTSLISTLLVGIIFAAIAGRVAEIYAIRSQARAAALYVSEFAAPRLVAKDFAGPPGNARVQFEFALRDLIGKAGIVRVTVWNRSGEALYGEPPGASGLPSTQLLQNALRGRLQVRLLRTNGTRQVEIFVPILVANDLRPVGVYDVVSELGELAPTLVRLKWSVWGVVIFGMLLLYGVLFTIVREASRNLARQEEALRRAFAGAVQSLANAVDARDNALAKHSSRVSYYGAAIAHELGLSDELISEAQIVGALHDLGKIGIPDGVLAKRGPLTSREWSIMRLHPEYGYEILRPVPVSENIKFSVRHSHERWDGEGYPDGLAGERIPIVARIIAVADAYEALITDRPYRQPLDPDEAFAEIERCSGTHFDPQVVSAFIRVMRYAPRAEDLAFATP